MTGVALAWGLALSAALLGAAAIAIRGDAEARAAWGKMLAFVLLILLLVTLRAVTR